MVVGAAVGGEEAATVVWVCEVARPAYSHCSPNLHLLWRTILTMAHYTYYGALALLAEPDRVEIRVELDVGQVRVAGARGVKVEQEACAVVSIGAPW